MTTNEDSLNALGIYPVFGPKYKVLRGNVAAATLNGLPVITHHSRHKINLVLFAQGHLSRLSATRFNHGINFFAGVGAGASSIWTFGVWS